MTGSAASDTQAAERWFVALDIDGTVLNERGALSDSVVEEVRRISRAGNEVTLATGRSVSMTLPVLDKLGLSPEYVICANGAIVLKRAPETPMGYSRFIVETFDPSAVLRTIGEKLSDASFAVEDEAGVFRYTGHFPEGALATASERVEFEQLLGVEATRVVVFAPERATDDFLRMIDAMGLHQVSYSVGWTSWLDIAPEGVSKATALEHVRSLLGVPRSRVVAIGDGRNDIEMLEWASVEGVGVAMGQAPDEVHAAASWSTASDLEDGAAQALARIFQGPAATLQ